MGDVQGQFHMEAHFFTKGFYFATEEVKTDNDRSEFQFIHNGNLL